MWNLIAVDRGVFSQHERVAKLLVTGNGQGNTRGRTCIRKRGLAGVIKETVWQGRGRVGVSVVQRKNQN